MLYSISAAPKCREISWDSVGHFGTPEIYQISSMVREILQKICLTSLPALYDGKARSWGYRVDSRCAPSQWENALLCNDSSHWLGASLESALRYVICNQCDEKAYISCIYRTGKTEGYICELYQWHPYFQLVHKFLYNESTGQHSIYHQCLSSLAELFTLWIIALFRIDMAELDDTWWYCSNSTAMSLPYQTCRTQERPNFKSLKSHIIWDNYIWNDSQHPGFGKFSS